MEFTKIDVGALKRAAARYVTEAAGRFASERPEKVVEATARGAGIILTALGESLKQNGEIFNLIGAQAGDPQKALALRAELIRFLGYVESASIASGASSAAVSPAASPVAPATFEAGNLAPTAERAAALKVELGSVLRDLKAATERASSVQASLAELLGVDFKP